MTELIVSVEAVLFVAALCALASDSVSTRVANRVLHGLGMDR